MPVGDSIAVGIISMRDGKADGSQRSLEESTCPNQERRGDLVREFGDTNVSERVKGEGWVGELQAGDGKGGDRDASGVVAAGGLEAGDLAAGGLEAGDLEAGDLAAGGLEAGDLEAGDLEAGVGEVRRLDSLPSPAGPVYLDPMNADPVGEAARVLSRAAASVGTLQRALQEASAGLSKAWQFSDPLAEVVVRLRQSLAEARADQLAARIAVEEQRKQRTGLLEQEDRFLAQLIDDHEARVRGLIIERDAARQDLEALQMERAQLLKQAWELGESLDSSRGRVRDLELEQAALLAELEALQAEAAEGPTPLEEEVVQLREHLTAAEAQVHRMVEERERAREMLRRLQAQRDEAQRELSQMARAHDPALDEATLPPTDRRPEPTDRINPSARPSPLATAVAAASTKPPQHSLAGSGPGSQAHPSLAERRSALAMALEVTDPARRR